MENEFLRDMGKVSHGDWSYPFAFGWLVSLVRQYLRADIDRDAFTARFALLDAGHRAFIDGQGGDEVAEEAWRLTRERYFGKLAGS